MTKIYLLIIVFCQFLCIELFAQESFQLRPYTRDYTLVGFTSPLATMTVSGEIAGRLQRVVVDIGDAVAESGEVAQLDTTFVIIDLEKNTIAQRQIEHRLELEKKTLERYTALITKNSTAQATFDNARVLADVLALELQSLKNEENRLREVLRRHTLSGPSGWLVIDRFAEPGEFLNVGAPVVQLGNFNKLIVSYSLTIEELRLLKVMDTTELILPVTEKRMVATLYRISPDIDKGTRKVGVELLLDVTGFSDVHTLRGGLRAQLIIRGHEEKNTFLVPVGAIKSRYEAHWLTTVGGSQEKVIVLGRSEDGQFAIITGSGLSAKEFYRVDSPSNSTQ